VFFETALKAIIVFIINDAIKNLSAFIISCFLLIYIFDENMNFIDDFLYATGF
jgi:hypothetical protein